MGLIRPLAILALLVGLIGCGGGSGSDDETTEPVKRETELGDPRESLETSTRMNVSVDLPQELVASLRPSSKSTSPGLGLIQTAVAAPVAGARMLVALVGSDGVVAKVLGPEDGLVVNDNGDGTYTVIMPGDPTVNGMVVADPSGGSQVQMGFELPSSTFYAPARGGNVTISPESTVATRVALNYIDDFNGISSEELSSLVDTLSRIATGLVERMNELNLGQLEADLTAATYDYLVNAVAQAKQDLLFDASGYVGDYISISSLQSMHTAMTGSYVDIRSGYQQRALTVSIPLPATSEAVLDLSKLDFSYDAAAAEPGEGLVVSQLLQASGISRRALSFTTAPSTLPGMPVNYDGAIVASVPARAQGFAGNAANQVQLYAANGFFYGSDQTIGGLFFSARRDVFDAIADGGQVETEIAIKRSANFDIANLSGAYGALISTTSVGTALTKVRGTQLYNATSGSFAASTPQDGLTITQSANSSINATIAPANFGAVVATSSADADGTLTATLGGRTYQGAGNGDGRLVHLTTADSTGTAGFATFVKLAASTSLANVSSKRYALFGAVDGFQYGIASTGAISGFLGLSDSTAIQYLDDSEAAEFSGLAVDHLPAAARSHAAFVNAQRLFDIAVNANGSISFSYADHKVQGFVQEGGDLLLLHDVWVGGDNGAYSRQAYDRYYYAVCFTGCTTTPDPALFSVGGEVQNLSGSVTLRLNGGESVAVSSSGAFAFSTPQTYGAAYSVEIASQPAAQSCAITEGATGTVTGDVAISVSCSNQYSIGGTVSGLNGTLVLQSGAETANVTADGAFTFATPLSESAASYAVTVATQPANQVCTVTNGSGTATANVTTIAVSCTATTYTVGGTVSGLSGSVQLQNNAGDTLAVSAAGAFTFPTALEAGAAYAVTVLTQPSAQTCTITGGTGAIAANVTNVAISCL